MNVLGIESSCDETAVSVVVDGHNVLSNVISSQIQKHSPYGGVIPELAAREHLHNIKRVCQEALLESKLSMSDIDGIAVTSHPGLLPALLVGSSFAQGLAFCYNIALVGLNHLLAHIYAGFIPYKNLLKSKSTFPILCLLVSGGHTNLLLIDIFGKLSYIGGTLDDAAGEAYDKVARLLRLSYPGGPIIDKLAKKGDPNRYKLPCPLSMKTGRTKEENRYNFSFSGIKTAVYYLVKDKELNQQDIYDVCASFQKAVVEVLIEKTLDASNKYEVKSIVLGGGVACNSALRQELLSQGENIGKQVILTEKKYCADNAAMIAGLGYYELKKDFVPLSVHSRSQISQLNSVAFI